MALTLLSGTLRTFQKHACDDGLLIIKCPHGTTISIQLAQYGRQAPNYLICPPTGVVDTPEPDPPPRYLGTDMPNQLQNDSVNCLSASSLQTVVDSCQEKKTCRIQTSPETFGSDPCPGIRKYVEVAYKCRPNEFRSKVICEGEALQLKCQLASRIAIYSANFGRTHHGSVECRQPEGLPEEDCQASYATETVMRICHGRRKCSMTADSETFGNPCEEPTRKYLRVVYTCAPKKILKDRYQGGVDSEDTEEDSNEGDEELVEEPSYDPSSSPEFYDPNTRLSPKPTKDTKRKSDPPSSGPYPSSLPAPSDASDEDSLSDLEGDLQVNCTSAVSIAPNTDRVIGFVVEWIAARKFIRVNSEKLILYLALSFGAGLVAFMGLVIAWLVVARKRDKKRVKVNITDPLPDAFAEEISDVDQDISDLTRPAHQESVEVVRFSTRSTTRRQGDSDTNPRAPMSRTQQSNFYYS
uniref:SUEL-type lectin domain-containing protein n=1 Tax=Strigamia maritima TaxID=126957 RepID=T1JAU7_STRMM